MRIYRFECRTWDETGEPGWQPAWIPGADPFEGNGCAHDILEHCSDNEDGSVATELEALGAILFTRGESGYWQSYGHMYPYWWYHTAGDLQFMHSRHRDGENDWFVPKLQDRSGTRRLDAYLEEEIERVLIEAKKQIRAETDAHEEPASDDELWGDTLSDAHLEYMRRRFRVGFRRAQRRYKCAYAAKGLFNSIADQASRLLEMAQLDFDVMEVRVDLSRMTAKATIKEGFYEYA